MVNHHTALIYTMVLVSAADGEMTDAELTTIGTLVQTLPVFQDFDPERLTASAADCAELLAGEGGLDTVLGMIAKSLPAKLRETAYALGCDVAAADHETDQEELRILELIRHQLDLDRLAAVAIERGVRARHATL